MTRYCYICYNKPDAHNRQITYEDKAELAEHLSTEHTPGELTGRILQCEDTMDYYADRMKAVGVAAVVGNKD